MGDQTQETILEFVRSLDSANQSVHVGTDLIETGALDSLAVMEVIAFLTDKFKITIPVTEVTPNNLRSVTALAGLVKACHA